MENKELEELIDTCNIEDLKKLELESKLQDSVLLYNEPMSKHTSFKTGGPCDLYVEVGNKQDLITLLSIIKDNNIPSTIVGNGSNLLVRDGGLDGIAIKFKDKTIEINDLEVTAASGVVNAYLGNVLLNHELGGFEFACGIPGTIGGAIYMNAGAYGSEMKNVITEVEFVNLDSLITLVKKIFTCYIINRSKISYENLVSATEWKKILDRESIE